MDEFYEERISDKHFRMLGDFTCGADDPLDIFLSDNAIKYDNDRLGATYLVIADGEIIAFYTLKVNAIQIQDEYGEPEAYPMTEISRIAVSYEYQGGGIGKRVFYDMILPKVEAIGKIAAVYGIMVFVESDNKRGIDFYKSIGFEKAGENIQKAIHDGFNDGCDLYVTRLKQETE